MHSMKKLSSDQKMAAASPLLLFCRALQSPALSEYSRPPCPHRHRNVALSAHIWPYSAFFGKALVQLADEKGTHCSSAFLEISTSVRTAAPKDSVPNEGPSACRMERSVVPLVAPGRSGGAKYLQPCHLQTSKSGLP